MRGREVSRGPTLAEEPPVSTPPDTPPVRGEQTVVGDYSVVTGLGLLSALLSLLSAILVTRLLLPAAFGVLSLVLVTSTVLQSATSSWTSQAVARFGRERLELRGGMAEVTNARLVIALPAFGICVLIVVGLKALDVLPAELTWPLVGLAIAHGAVVIVYEHAVNLLQSWGRQRLSALAVLLQQVVLLVVVGALLATSTHTTPLAIGLLYTAANFLLALIYLATLRGVGIARRPRDRVLERRMWTFSAPLIAYTASSYVIGSVDVWVLGAFRPAAVVGAYAAAYRGYMVLMGTVSAASPVLTTLFVSLRLAGRHDDIRGFTERVVPASMLAFGVVVGFLAAPAYALVPLVFGHSFSAASLPTAILMISLVAYLQCCLLGTVLTSHDRTREAAAANVGGAVLNIVADLIAVGLLGAGAWAPAAATAASGLLVAFGYSLATMKVTRSSLQFPWVAFLPAGLAVAALAALPAGDRVLGGLAVGIVAGLIVLVVRGPRVGLTPQFLRTLVRQRRRARVLDVPRPEAGAGSGRAG
jgi:O-antigen/teichoic acid export membrane protein